MPAAYCTLGDVQDRLSVEGVADRVDDDPDAADAAIDEASSAIEEYCFASGYPSANLAGVRWVKYKCVDIAAALFCERRGNPVPSSVARKRDRALETLERVRRGAADIPGAARSKSAVPVLSQPTPKLWPDNHTEIERSRSSTRNLPTDYAQRTDREDLGYYQI